MLGDFAELLVNFAPLPYDFFTGELIIGDDVFWGGGIATWAAVFDDYFAEERVFHGPEMGMAVLGLFDCLFDGVGISF